MTDQPQPSIGTVAEEAARLISAMATMARSSGVLNDDSAHDFAHDFAHDTGPYAGGPAQAPEPPETEQTAPVCSACGGQSNGSPVACRLCPVCQGIALLRAVRPETVDRLADLASAVAGSLRDMATQSRASGPGSEAGPQPGTHSDRVTVQDIRVDDEDEG